MIKYFNIILFFILFNIILSEKLSLESANQIVTNLIIDKDSDSSISDISELVLYPNLYFVNLSPSGFVIISKEDRAMPVLGYSFNNSIDINNFPFQLKNILSSYNQSIEYIIQNNIQQDIKNDNFLRKYLNENFSRIENSRNIEPLITADWNQGGGWNEFCPSNSLVGCVAVAMAQVMYYWEHPFQGVGYSQYYDPMHGIISVNFEEHNYDFSNMFDDYPTTDSQLLLYHSGVAVHMDYSPWGSGASVCWEGPSSQDALDNHFGYNDIVTCEVKINYTDEEWESLIKDQLNRGWPIVYRGYSGDSGHAWNMDGYQDNYYHCNWGWGGSANGYFYFDNLNGGGYNFIDNQAALLNIIPENIIAPTALFEFSINSLAAIFYDLSDIINEDNIVSWHWDFGDGQISSEPSPIHTYSDYGEYEISLIVTNEFGLSSQPHIEYLELYDFTGDINNDNYVDVIDIVTLINIIFNADLNQNYAACDLNFDNQINVLDVVLLVQLILE